MKNRNMLVATCALAALTLSPIHALALQPTWPLRGDQEQTRAGVVDAPIEAFRVELLQLAFEAASAMPTDPHIKNRSRAQAAVVDASLELGQPELALVFLADVRNWRSGTGLADLALYCAEHGSLAEAEIYMERAALVAETLADDDEQGWRAGRIREKLAEVSAIVQRAGRSSLSGDQERQETSDVLPLSGELSALDEVIRNGEFEQAALALEQISRLYGKHYSDPDQREKLASKLRSSWKVLPRGRLIELIFELAEAALEHGDRARARAWIAESRELIESGDWLPEDLTPFQARAAELRALAGQEAEARVELAAAYRQYQGSKAKIYDVFRPAALIPLAEAYATLLDFEQALAFYSEAIDEAWSNPNSRPRAETLSRVCTSLAIRGVHPNAELRERLTANAHGLSAPW